MSLEDIDPDLRAKGLVVAGLASDMHDLVCDCDDHTHITGPLWGLATQLAIFGYRDGAGWFKSSLTAKANRHLQPVRSDR